jgi:superfamily II DNA or RNA helicase
MRTCNEARLPLVLSERKRHLQLLKERVEKHVDHCFVLTGGMGKKRTRDALAGLSEVGTGESAVLLATGKFVGEGFDHPSLDTLFLVFPVSWRGIVQQYVGRIHRRHADKHELRVYDYADTRVPPLAASFRRRTKSYKSMGYRITDSAPGE